MHRCDRKPKISVQPAPSYHQSPTCSQTVRRNGLGPITISRRSKIGPNHLPAPTCVQASVRTDTQGKHTECAVAPSLFDTLADCAPPRAQSHHRFSTVENRSRRPTTPSCVQVSFDRIPEVSIQHAPSRRLSSTRSQTVRRNGHSLVTVSRRSKIGPITFPHQHACKPRYDRIPKVSMQPASLRHRSSTRSQTVRRHGHSPTTASRRSKIGHVDQPRQHACKPRYDRIPEVSIQHAPPHHELLTLSRTLCEAAGTVSPPLLDKRKSVTSAQRAIAHERLPMAALVKLHK
jgi:hypothetical protein